MSLVVYSSGICHCSICTDLKDLAEIEAETNRLNPPGETFRWHISKDQKFASGQSNPCPCNQFPATHRHFLLSC